jgi:branched-subunit amino acid ABC-type transport system permease component
MLVKAAAKQCGCFRQGSLVSSFLVGQVVSPGSLVYAQMAPFAVMPLILLVRPTRLFGSPLLKR